jgi:hypothetical protein
LFKGYDVYDTRFRSFDYKTETSATNQKRTVSPTRTEVKPREKTEAPVEFFKGQDMYGARFRSFDYKIEAKPRVEAVTTRDEVPNDKQFQVKPKEAPKVINKQN